MSEPTFESSVMKAIHERRSIRSYAPQKLDQATIRALLDAAVWAPTAVHEEPWLFSIVQDVAVLKSLSERAKKIFAAQAEQAHPEQAQRLLDIVGQPDFNIFYNASTLIVISAKPKGLLSSRIAGLRHKTCCSPPIRRGWVPVSSVWRWRA